MVTPQPLYVAARTVLLDALDALRPWHPALTIVGAQAVYLRPDQLAWPVPPYTTDADLSLEPERISVEPSLAEALHSAGFREPQRNPGEWLRTVSIGGRSHPITVDLMVPESLVVNKGRRSARLPGQSIRLARRTPGLDAAVVDRDRRVVRSLDDADTRSHEVFVAGPVAMLLAKTVKIDERAGSRRQQPKDALDLLRVLYSVSAEELTERARRVLQDPRIGQVAAEQLARYRVLFGKQGEGWHLASQALVDLEWQPRDVRALVDRSINALHAASA